MRFHDSLPDRYLAVAPMALAIERLLECDIFSGQPFESPILDLGCGDGVFADVLFAEPLDLGVDIDPGEIAYARRTGAYRDLLACPGDSIPSPDNSFRTIFSNSVLEHIPGLDAVLGEAHRLLMPGGRFLATVPTDRFERYAAGAMLLEWLGLSRAAIRFRSFYNHFWQHYHAYDVADWQRRFEAAGFRVVEWRTYDPQPLVTFCDLIVPLAVPSIAAKKLLGRWIAVPRLRRLYVPALAMVSGAAIARWRDHTEGGLVFFALTRD